MRIKKGDSVKVIAGDDKGKIGKVLAVFPKKSMVVVEGCKLVKKSMKPTDDNPKDGHMHKEMPMHISNVKKEEE
ncbi:50S ribosomal protein L24 [Helicobacter ailurogastricus]|uniref:50S ribosomal protein L24 n=1 Tax=Helicobacter ailurogastricus TaxID=1578720 RepID=UPI0022BD20B6|nr:50S ribosomal protein L24 [Helicobacter ailurogastricus]GLH58008.1 50S ribosomal protein L24 [Helicobacter ailurogastricus]GLH59045.1 50S ribosomal protein L24 [Helicobacter ailurogastricus]GMB91365.1 50S ribosomal protein L24 [Helicobacter ailurogastricus]